ncbi:MAG: LTA synthase family protein [Lachnobacterium sp.]|nr:LTA synthase family protein [Lachnobacterium sp.]
MKKILDKTKSILVKAGRFLFVKKEKEHSARYNKIIDTMNKYSLVGHALIALTIVFLVEVISRRDLISAFQFVGTHTLAYLYNSFLVFASLTLVYFFRRRAFWRVVISGFWTILGIINGCVLSNRVTPFGYTDLKCIPELFAMNNTSYFTAEQATVVVFGLGAFALFLVALFIKGPRYQGKLHYVMYPIACLSLFFVGIPLTTNAAQSTNIVADYYTNIAQGYEDYGFVYSFSSSVVDRGMQKPDNYSEDTIAAIETNVETAAEQTTTNGTDGPNIICVLLESFCDPEEINFLETSEDPIPTFHYLEDNFSSGYLTVPVVGAGTANTEFEVLTGMSMQYFGTGEYPYKTILKKTDCEAIASDLSKIGYSSHVVHNNGGNFYSRANAFSMMGFDTFTSKELMNITALTPNGSWSTDDILVNETMKTLDATPGSDFTYTITVCTHGDYPTEPVIENPAITVSGVDDEAQANQWTYYVNQLNASDRFITSLIDRLSQRDEDTVVVMFGDHLPTMGLTDDDMKSGDIYKTKYITWNNFGLEKKDADLYAYQLLASITDSVGIHEGTIFNYHQTQSDSATYLEGLENLQYDILYGKRYCYNGEDLYPASDLVMGIDDVEITDIRPSAIEDKIYIYGKNFTQSSRVFINGEKVSCTQVSTGLLSISKDAISDGDTVVVNQMGSSNTVFRSSNEWTYLDPNVEHETETETEVSTETESTEAKDTETTETENTESKNTETESSENGGTADNQ